MAKRIQRKRTKGWRMPEGAVYVGRPTKWGNPAKVSRLLSADCAMAIYAFLVWPDDEGEKELNNRHKFFLSVARGKWTRISMDEIERELRGKDLACWCPLDQSCHADVLLEIANN
jgi:Domain of unknown function (DUF4326)